MTSFDYAVFGNIDGSHQLLESSLNSEDGMLEELRFLVDRPVGHVNPDVIWSPYWGCSPVRDWWTLWRGDEDQDAPRKNMVKSRAVLVHQEAIGDFDSVQNLLKYLSFDVTSPIQVPIISVINAISDGKFPVIVFGKDSAPALLNKLWPYLWPTAKRQFSIRTLFGSESLNVRDKLHIAVVPVELRLRWQGYSSIEEDKGQTETNAFPDLDRIIKTNWERLPGDLTILARLKRLALALTRLRSSSGKLSDALLVVRTVEAFDGGLELDSEDLILITSYISEMREATMIDIRTASLVRLTILADHIQAEAKTSSWIRENLPKEADPDALWVLENQARNDHELWWLRGVRKGLSDAFGHLDSMWAAALWRWWSKNPKVVKWMWEIFDNTPKFEESLIGYIPPKIEGEIHKKLISLFSKRQWAKLVAVLLHDLEPLEKAVKLMQDKLANPAHGLEILLRPRTREAIVTAAAASNWAPLIDHAVKETLQDISLFQIINLESPGALRITTVHLQQGGQLPPTVKDEKFILRIFDGCLDGDEDCFEILKYIEANIGAVSLLYNRQEDLWDALGPYRRRVLIRVTASEWLKSFIAETDVKKPSPVLSEIIREQAREILSRGQARILIRYLRLFDEVSEKQVVNWLADEGFSWQPDDHQSFAALLLERQWREAARSFRYSWKKELNVVAWYARDLSRLWEGFWSPPEGISQTDKSMPLADKRNSAMKILFLASNPITSNRLAIDEETRSIEEKIRGSKHRDCIQFHSCWATRPGDLQQALLEIDPTIVHFSGHGSGTSGIVLHSDDGTENYISGETLVNLLAIFKDNVRVVVLNACFSEVQGLAIVKELDFVVGMSDSIGDDGAKAFAAAFYRGLAFGKSVQVAFNLGINELELIGLNDDVRVPILMTRNGMDASAVSLVQSTE